MLLLPRRPWVFVLPYKIVAGSFRLLMRRPKPPTLAQQHSAVIAQAVFAATGKWPDGYAPLTQHRTLRQSMHRHRKALQPVAAAALVALARVLLPDFPSPGWVFGWAAIVGLWVWWFFRVNVVNRGGPVGAFAAGVAWVSVAHVDLPAYVDLLSWLGVVAGAVAIRLHHFRVRPHVERTLTPLEEVWRNTLGAANGVLAGSRVLPGGALDARGNRSWDHLDPKNGERLGTAARVAVVRGKHTWRHVRAARVQIASACGVDEGQVLVDAWEGDAGSAELVILDNFTRLRDALSTPVLFEPTLNIKTGIYVHGRRIDGHPSLIQVFDRDEGTTPVWMSGQMKTGKSVSCDTLLGNIVWTRIASLIIFDFKPGGRSLPDWEPACLPLEDGRHAYITHPHEALEMLRRIRAWAELRGQMMKEMRTPSGGAVKCLAPSLAHPGLVLLADEAPEMFKQSPGTVAEWQWCVRMLRAFGVIPVLTGQPTTATDAFGGSNAIKEAHQAGTVIVHRNSKAAGGRTAQSALSVDPSTLPHVPGAGWVLSSAEDPDDTVMRSMYLPDPHTIAAMGPVRLSEAEEAILCKPLGQAKSSGNIVQLPQKAGSKTEQLKLDVAAFVTARSMVTNEPVRTAVVLEEFEGRASEDGIGRALRAAAAEGLLGDAGHGQWSAPHESMEAVQ